MIKSLVINFSGNDSVFDPYLKKISNNVQTIQYKTIKSINFHGLLICLTISIYKFLNYFSSLEKQDMVETNFLLMVRIFINYCSIMLLISIGYIICDDLHRTYVIIFLGFVFLLHNAFVGINSLKVLFKSVFNLDMNMLAISLLMFSLESMYMYQISSLIEVLLTSNKTNDYWFISE